MPAKTATRSGTPGRSITLLLPNKPRLDNHAKACTGYFVTDKSVIRLLRHPTPSKFSPERDTQRLFSILPHEQKEVADLMHEVVLRENP